MHLKQFTPTKISKKQKESGFIKVNNSAKIKNKLQVKDLIEHFSRKPATQFPKKSKNPCFPTNVEKNQTLIPHSTVGLSNSNSLSSNQRPPITSVESQEFGLANYCRNERPGIGGDEEEKN